MHLYFIRFEFWAKVVNLPVCAVDYLTEKGGEMENKGLKVEIVPAEMYICRKIPHLSLQHAIHIHCKPFGAECPPCAGISYRLAVIFLAVTNKKPTFAFGNR